MRWTIAMTRFGRLWLSSMALMASASLADNPIIQTKFTADPAPMVFDGGVYLYTSHDEDDATGFTMYDWLLYTSTDMVNWTDHGVIGGVRAPTKTFAWGDGYNAWAPQCVFRDGKFYLYCPLPSGGGHMGIGVAVSDSPLGPFKDAIGSPLINNPGSTDDIDPTVFIDDGGQAYLYWGHQRLFYVRLNQDMISYSGSIVELPRPNLYEEGPWFYRRNGHYYLAFASTCCSEGIGYAMSDSPTGPWTSKGHVMKPNAASSGNHPGIIDFQGSSYVFGFNYALNLAETTVHRERRSINVSKMTYNDDGTIVETPWWVSDGVAQLGKLNPYVRTEAETIAWSKGLKTESCSEGGMDVTKIGNGDFIKVKGVDFGPGAVSFAARVASAGSGGSIEIRLDSQTGTLVGTCAVQSTGAAQTWTTKTCAISGASGVHDLFFVFTGNGESLFSFNWWKFDPLVSVIDAGVVPDGGEEIDSGSGGDAGVSPGAGGGSAAGGAGGAGGTGGAGGGGGAGGAGGVGGVGGGGGRDGSAGVVGTLGCSSSSGGGLWLGGLLAFLGGRSSARRTRRLLAESPAGLPKENV